MLFKCLPWRNDWSRIANTNIQNMFKFSRIRKSFFSNKSILFHNLAGLFRTKS